MNGREVLRLHAALRLLWPHSPALTDDDVKVLMQIGPQVLGDITAAEAQAWVAEQSRAGAEFVPTLGQIANGVLGVRELADGTAAPDPDQAWARVRRSVARRGYALGPPSPGYWNHPAIADAVEAIGWRELCLSERGDILRAHFNRYYTDAKARHQARLRRTPAMKALIEGAHPPPSIGP